VTALGTRGRALGLRSGECLVSICATLPHCAGSRSYLFEPATPNERTSGVCRDCLRLIKGESGQIVLLTASGLRLHTCGRRLRLRHFNHVIVADAFDVLTPQMVKSYSPTAHIVTSTDLGKRRLKVEIQSILKSIYRECGRCITGKS